MMPGTQLVTSFFAILYFFKKQKNNESLCFLLTCNQEHDPSGHGCSGFALGPRVHEVGALHAHRGDQHSQGGEEHAEHYHGPGGLDLSWRRRRKRRGRNSSLRANSHEFILTLTNQMQPSDVLI